MNREIPDYVKVYNKLEKFCTWAENSLGDQEKSPESNLYKACLNNLKMAEKELDNYNKRMSEFMKG